MAKYYTSDLHFGHANIIGFCNRPYGNSREMNEDIVIRWNEVVAPDDEVVILGDLCLGKLSNSLVYVSQLNGHKILMLGNHDRPFGLTNKVAQAHWCDVYREAGIAEIIVGPIKVRLAGQDVVLCHFPYANPTEPPNIRGSFESDRAKDTGDWLLHGHVHGKWRQKGRMIDVGIDAWGGKPVSEEQLIALIEAGVNDLPPIEWR